MAKDLKEQIEIMTHYLNGGEIMYRVKDDEYSYWSKCVHPLWDWFEFEYKIKKQKITIEKWLIYDISDSEYFTIETSDISTACKGYYWEKIKLLESYEIEL